MPSLMSWKNYDHHFIFSQLRLDSFCHSTSPFIDQYRSDSVLSTGETAVNERKVLSHRASVVIGEGSQVIISLTEKNKAG